MKMLSHFTSFLIWTMTLGVLVVKADIFDDFMSTNWRNSNHLSKRTSPFFNQFGFTFPLFLESDTDDLKTSNWNDGVGTDSGSNVKPNSDNRHGMEKPQPPISELFNIRETPQDPPTQKGDRKTENGALKPPVKSEDKIIPTSEGEKGKPTSWNPQELVKREVDDKVLPWADDFEEVGKKKKLDLDSQTVVRKPGRSFPRGLTDLLIVFRNMDHKPKSHHHTTPNHNCVDANCPGGICKVQEDMFNAELNSQQQPQQQHLLQKQAPSSYPPIDHVTLFVLPIALGVGLIVSIWELRRIFLKMKKQTVIATYAHQQC